MSYFPAKKLPTSGSSTARINSVPSSGHSVTSYGYSLAHWGHTCFEDLGVVTVVAAAGSVPGAAAAAAAAESRLSSVVAVHATIEIMRARAHKLNAAQPKAGS